MIQNKPYIVALTGGIASGKSAVANIIIDRGFTIIDADILSREIFEDGSDVIEKVEDVFGSDIINRDGTLNRGALGSIVFKDRKKRLLLESITHPAIFNLLAKKLSDKSDKKILFIDMALLVENLKHILNCGIIIDEIWVVDIPNSLQLKRLMDRDNIDAQYAQSKINSQISRELRLEKADVIIDNSGDFQSLKDIVETELNNLIIRMENAEIDEES